MSKYTTTIKNLIDNNFDFKMTSYPIFDEEYRETLNNNILYHYYESEIGFETAALFRLYLNQKLNEIMPFYNMLYQVQKEILEDPKQLIANVNITETLERNTENKTESESISESNGNSKSKNLFQDTPQGQIKNIDIDNYNYATNLTLNKNDTKSDIKDNSKTSGLGNENYIKKIIGNNGSKYTIDLLISVKDNLMNIDLMIIEELNELFMGIF